MKVNKYVTPIQVFVAIYVVGIVIMHTGFYPLPEITLKNVWLVANIAYAGFLFLALQLMRERNE